MSDEASRESEVLTVGVDLGGTNMQLGVVNARHEIVGRAKKKTKPDEGAEAVLGRLADGVAEACAEAGIELEQVRAVGVAAAGAIDMPRGVILNAPNLGWIDVVSRRIPGPHLHQWPLRSVVRSRLRRS